MDSLDTMEGLPADVARQTLDIIFLEELRRGFDNGTAQLAINIVDAFHGQSAQANAVHNAEHRAMLSIRAFQELRMSGPNHNVDRGMGRKRRFGHPAQLQRPCCH